MLCRGLTFLRHKLALASFPQQPTTCLENLYTTNRGHVPQEGAPPLLCDPGWVAKRSRGWGPVGLDDRVL